MAAAVSLVPASAKAGPLFSVASHSSMDETEPLAYTALKFLNQGSFGSVHTAIHVPTGNQVAIKEMRKTVHNEPSLRREAVISLQLHHPGIVETYDAFETDNSVILIQEYMAGGDLYEYMENNGGRAAGQEHQVKLWLVQVLAAVEYMHEVAGVVHRDIKPENIVLSEDRTIARLLDFGLSNVSDTNTRARVQGKSGTDPYMAEEVFNMADNDLIDGRAADMWSLGITLFTMIVGQFPWKYASRDHKSYTNYKAQHALCKSSGLRGAVFPSGPEDMGFTAHLGELLDRLLDPNPASRIRPKDVYQYLHLPWFNESHALYTPSPLMTMSYPYPGPSYIDVDYSSAHNSFIPSGLASWSAQMVPATPPILIKSPDMLSSYVTPTSHDEMNRNTSWLEETHCQCYMKPKATHHHQPAPLGPIYSQNATKLDQNTTHAFVSAPPEMCVPQRTITCHDRQTRPIMYTANTTTVDPHMPTMADAAMTYEPHMEHFAWAWP